MNTNEHELFREKEAVKKSCKRGGESYKKTFPLCVLPSKGLTNHIFLHLTGSYKSYDMIGCIYGTVLLRQLSVPNRNRPFQLYCKSIFFAKTV